MPFYNYNSRIGMDYFDDLVERCLNYDYKERPTAE